MNHDLDLIDISDNLKLGLVNFVLPTTRCSCCGLRFYLLTTYKTLSLYTTSNPCKHRTEISTETGNC